ncbi:uncharacterized protein AKAW2_60584S [Aspergillus luchuensis]|uniref:Uncharacterized protein n=1 Tax=Aspergillus kawachii TaxID=1069201 RepID=A0A7R8A2S1_ASPKA|nr:uncharacterized protein AKAW2_60584S [Aspergillus luchuensis]BCS02320.1 hypothetical protein AKAW2_60584S [Aspergillus luchuensis]GAA86310.1 hypothetical protein AKAW_04424 [Aspergillus luchuensis IFO 4308]
MLSAFAVLVVAFPILAMSDTVYTSTTMKTEVTTVTDTYVQVIEGHGMYYNKFLGYLAGSIVDVNTVEGQTTIVLNCTQGIFARCDMEANRIPPTITVGPSTYIHSSSGTTQDPQKSTIGIDSRACRIISSTQRASCETYVSSWWSDPTTIMSMERTSTTTLGPADITYHHLTITAGAEKLSSPVTATQAQNKTAVATSTALTSTTTAAPSPSPTPETHSSRAWIAGPVAGAVAGCGLVVAVLYWCLRRKIQGEPSADAGPIIQDPSGEIKRPGSPVKYMAAETQGTPVSELPADEPSCVQHTT